VLSALHLFCYSHRKIQVLRCSNGACGKDGFGKFCQECGHRTVQENKFGVLIICKGKLEDGQNCNSELLPGQNYCMTCGMKVEQPVQQVLEDKFSKYLLPFLSK
jgi:rRNA maturation protein Nop10